MQDLIIISRLVIIYALGLITLCGFCGVLTMYIMGKPKHIKKVIHNFNGRQVKNKRVA